MDNPQGKVVAVRRTAGRTHVSIEVDMAAVCPRCAEGKGCGAAIFGASSAPRRLELEVPPGRDIETGQTVSLELPPGDVLRAAASAYGLPLTGAALGAAVAYAMELGDAAAAVAALLGIAAGMLLARLRLQRSDCLARLVPRIR